MTPIYEENIADLVRDVEDLTRTWHELRSAKSDAEHACKQADEMLKHRIRQGESTGDKLIDYLYADVDIDDRTCAKIMFNVFRDEIARHQGEQFLKVHMREESTSEGYQLCHDFSLGIIAGPLEFKPTYDVSKGIHPYAVFTSHKTVRKSDRTVQNREEGWKLDLTETKNPKFNSYTFRPMMGSISRMENGDQYRIPTRPSFHGRSDETYSRVFIGNVDVLGFFTLGMEKYDAIVKEIKEMPAEKAKERIRAAGRRESIHDPSYGVALRILGQDVPPEFVEPASRPSKGERVYLTPP